MIRILHSVSNMDRAGIETMLMNYYRHVNRAEVQFDFLCNKQKPGAYEAEILDMGGRIFRTPGLGAKKYGAYMRYMRALFAQHPEYKIMHAHNGAFAVQALYAAKASGVPVRIFHAHGAAITKDWKYPLKMACMAVLPHMYNQRFACGQEAARCYFGSACADGHAYTFVKNAIEPARFCFDAQARNRIRQAHGLGNRLVIGHVGRLMAQKNHAFLLQAFARLHRQRGDATLVLLGDGELMEKVRTQAQRLGLSDHVLFAGNVQDTGAWYQAFDAFVLPSIWEGLPVVGIEAQAADLPCVFSSAVTRETAITQDVRFLPLDAGEEAWAQALLSLATRERPRRNNAYLVAQAGYDVSLEADRLCERYAQLIKDVDRP